MFAIFYASSGGDSSSLYMNEFIHDCENLRNCINGEYCLMIRKYISRCECNKQINNEDL